MRGKNARGALGKASGKWLERNYCSTLWIIIKHSTRTKTPIFFFACLTFRPSLLSSWQRAVVLQQRCQPLEISNLEIFFRTSPPPPPPPDRVRRCDLSPGNLFFLFGPPNSPPPPPMSNFAGKIWIYLSRTSIGWILIQSDSLLCRSNKEETLFFLFATNNAHHARNWSQKP